MIYRMTIGGGRRRAGAGLALAAAVLAGGGCRSLPEVAPAREPAVAIRGYREAASRLRGLPMEREVAVERETPEALKVSLEKELEKPENQAFLADTELLMRQFRILQGGASLKALYLRLMQEQVAAYYDPEKKRLAYVEQDAAATNKNAALSFPGMERFIYVHEFCHAIEDAHFDLDRLSKASQGEFDRYLAATSLMEGNAVLAGVDGLLENTPVNTATPFGACCVRLLGRAGMEEASEEMEGVPPFLTGVLIRPYLDGAVFSNRIRRDAGWQSIDRCYRSRVPLTTAEILYPERRYLKGFQAAVFTPETRLFAAAHEGVATNTLGALGTALWLGGDEVVTAHKYGFLKGWMGDRVYLIKGEHGAVQTVWLSYWERPGMARTFSRQVEKRLRARFQDARWRVRRDGRLVAAVWSGDSAERAACEALAERALQTRVEVDLPSLAGSWCNDLPWPVRFPVYEGHSAGCELLGGYAADVQQGPAFCRYNVASGLVLNVERTPDRHHVSTCFGLLRHVGDARSDFTYWKVPLLAAWHRQGSGEAERYRWSLLWGLLADGNERRSRVLFIPVWRKG